MRVLSGVLTGLVLSISSCSADVITGDGHPFLERLVLKIVLTVGIAGLLTALFVAFSKWIGRPEN